MIKKDSDLEDLPYIGHWSCGLAEFKLREAVCFALVNCIKCDSFILSVGPKGLYSLCQWLPEDRVVELVTKKSTSYLGITIHSTDQDKEIAPGTYAVVLFTKTSVKGDSEPVCLVEEPIINIRFQ